MKDPNDMRVKAVEFDFIVNERDWALCENFSTFSHNEACEFIFCIENHNFIDGYKAAGFSVDFVHECILAKNEGFRYICLYS